MDKIIAFAGSNSKSSINKQLSAYAASMLEGVEVDVLDLNDFELPLYSIDYETKNGIPDNAKQFLEQVKSSKGIVLSLAEHNGAYTAVFKNLMDWASRVGGKLWDNKPMLVMATSPGGRGGANVLEIAKGYFKYLGGNIVSSYSLPSFGSNFSNGKIINEELNDLLVENVKIFQKAL